MGLSELIKPKKTLAEMEEEREINQAEITLLEQRVMKKELQKRGVELSTFKDENGNVIWAKVKNFLRKL